MGVQRLHIVALVMTLSFTIGTGNARSFVLDVQLEQQRGPTCLVAAAVIAASARGAKLDMNTFVRSTPVFPDGIHPYDLTVTASKLGLSSLIFRGPPEAAARLVRAGFAPIALVASGAGRHAVVVTGVRRKEVPADNSNATLELRLADPSRHTHTWVSANTFGTQQSGQQMIVLFQKSEGDTLSSHGFPTKIAAQMDAQFRAETLFRRALKHSAPNAQMRALLGAALKWQPCHKAARTTWAKHNFKPAAQTAPLVHCDDKH